jgi:pectin-derived oligosaccharide transport system permease protein
MATSSRVLTASQVVPASFRPMQRLARHTFLIVLALVMLYPLLWMISASLRPKEDIFTAVGLWPDQATLDNYAAGWRGISGISFGRYFLNSLTIATLSIVGNLIACSMAAFAFARIEFTGRRVFFAIMLATIMLPYHVVVIPQYILFQQLGWVNTILPLVVPKFLATDAFFIFLMVQFVRGIPRELDEAAVMDGATPFQIFRRVILPLTLPALATTAIFTFIWTWNDFFAPLIYLTKPENFTVALGLRQVLDATGTSSFGSLFAMSVLALGPVFGFFIASQRYLIHGIATTGLK